MKHIEKEFKKIIIDKEIITKSQDLSKIRELIMIRILKGIEK